MFGTSKKQTVDELRTHWGKPKFANRNFYQIAKFHSRKRHADDVQRVTERTQMALDFTELFAFLDRTVSRVGQQWLCNRLLSYERAEDFDDFESAIQYWAANPNPRLDAQIALSQLTNENAYGICSLFFDAFPKPPRFLPWIWVQSILSIIALCLTLVNVKFFALFIFLLAMNSLIHYYCKGFIQQFAFSLDQLSWMTYSATEISKLPHPYKGKNQIGDGLKSLREITNIWNLLGSGSTGKVDVTELGWLLREYIKIIFLIEPVLFFRALKKLEHHKNDVRAVFEYVGFVDSTISVLSVRQSMTCCIPTRVTASKGVLNAEDMIHPLILGCIPNSLRIEDRSILITGSNMSGKSAFIRTVAINVLCAQTINTCFARTFASSFFKVHAVMNISDDLLLGKSYYMEEVLSIRELIRISEKETDCLFLLDEIFRGTNTTERVAAACSVLSFLQKQNIAIAATHDTELTTMLEQKFDMAHFCESIDDKGLTFDYVLKYGKLKHGNAIRILELNGYPADIVQMANALCHRQ
jgi:hypothetical protein